MSPGPRPDRSRGWTRYFFYTRQSLKTTWTFRVAVVAVGLLLGTLTRPLWVPAIGQSLVCRGNPAGGEVVLIENFDPNYLLFEHVALLRSQGLAGRVLVPVPESSDSGRPNVVSTEIVQVMARVARIPPPEIVPIREAEPISLNVARQLRDILRKQDVSSVIVVTDAFRSRRSSLVYEAVFEEAGIATSCVPVFGEQTADNWAQSWHGVQRVAQEFTKLQYYRFYVLPFLSRSVAS